jgi:hypothetical protein
MKIALFTPHNFLASHYALFSYRETLELMGHQVLDCQFPGNAIQGVPEVKKRMPSIETLCEQDVILSTFHEYVQPWLRTIYSADEWTRLRKKVPVIARFDESMDRKDLGLPDRIPELKAWADFYSFPAAQDAEKYGGQWLTFGADTTIFKPETLGESGPIIETRKKYDLGFIGSLYQDRRKYLEQLAPHIKNEVIFNCGNAFVQDIGGIRERESTSLLAENYRQIKIFFCLPPISRLIVSKTIDVMACGTFVMYPRLFGEAEKNLSLFEHKKEIIYYDVGYFADNGKQIEYYLEHEQEREKIARAGSELVRSELTFDQMLNELLIFVKKETVAT